MAKLNKKERAWLDELQEVLNRCPSERLGFFTTGDTVIHVYDRSKDQEIDAHQDRHGRDYCHSVMALDADFCDLSFPAAVHSTAG
ncbi:hypothetical protein [Serratia liquefaciens]|uniref:hypothetical protein n=1 Tax=Serratia liquefaciens TaxID=614 RepID=UPI00165D0236|nr:hypothetical protein [Serratia liquefaciens]QNQ52338.1 hypothetical protein IAI46_13815 [Serratia liquefaciens]QNQ52607.1 hypothetical protein IAI46_15270 [Serratia liquefaciens]QNQ56159.1 hypothetical protein IAI46_09415 [Serratia liquefaciens]